MVEEKTAKRLRAFPITHPISGDVLRDYRKYLDEVYTAEGLPVDQDQKYDYVLKAWGFLEVFLNRYGYKIIKDTGAQGGASDKEK